MAIPSGLGDVTAVDDVEGLVERLAQAMRERWECGERPLVEDFFNRHPALWSDPEHALDLIYEEICLRHKFGLIATPRSILRRFPQWTPQIETLFACHHLLEPLQAPQFPAPGDQLGDFLLGAEIGKGAAGRVFVATQASLGDRPVVLKVSVADAQEHLSLARLQHTHIMPVHATHLDGQRRLRLLCLPYLGGATLAKVLETLAATPPAQRTGAQLVAALDRVAAPPPAAQPDLAPTRELLRESSYVQAACYIGACLADALHHAHQRHLIHFDVKPSNVLLAADSEPLLLDFHLARGPLTVGMVITDELGGTPAYMPPEQRLAVLAVEKGEPVPQAVDHRTDVYSLAALLYETLSGVIPTAAGPLRSLTDLNPRVSIGLADLIAKSLHPDPEQRHADAAALAEDLRRHLHDLPLLTVPNRSWRERWRKWRRRQPGVFRFTLLLGAVALSAVAALLLAWAALAHRVDEAEEALQQARVQWRERGLHDEALTTLQRGLDHVHGWPLTGDLLTRLRVEQTRVLDSQNAARRRQLRGQLHDLAEDLRGLFGVPLPPMEREQVLNRCREIWNKRQQIVGEATEPSAIEDLLDVLLLQVGWRKERREAETLLDEAVQFAGARAVLEAERLRCGLPARSAPAPLAPSTAWEHYALGRSALQAGDVKDAELRLQQALVLQPHHRWAHFLLGQCWFRMERHADAVIEFTFCIGASPNLAVNHVNRAAAYAALGRDQEALADCHAAVTLQPAFAPAWYQRGLLHARLRQWSAANADFQTALRLGHAAADVHVQLALAALANRDRAAALRHVETSLRHDPAHHEASRLRARLLAMP